MLAPIVLFVYNRPWHTVQTLYALSQNELADQSVLYIYADGPKEDATEDQLKKIDEVRHAIRTKKWCKEVNIIESGKNKGLANSIIKGVTEIVNQYGQVIVLEDDIVTSIGFLKYMNEALMIYSDNESVGCIHAWNYDLDTKDYPESTFFLKGGDCWGWASWKRSWDLFETNGEQLMQLFTTSKNEYEFDRRGTHKYIEMLKSQINGTNDSWAIRWHASLFLANKYCLQPTRAIVKNIGLDNSGIHCGELNIIQNPIQFITLNKIEVVESEWFFKAFVFPAKDVKKENETQKWLNSRTLLKKLFHHFVSPFLESLKMKAKDKNAIKIWSGDYQSWGEAQVKTSGYDNNTILQKCKDALLKVKNGKAVYERDSVLFNEIQYSWGLLAGLQKAALENKGKLCVLDFGGSLGSTYYQNKEFLNPLDELQWCIVEQRNFVDCGKEYFEDKQLKFYYTVEECILQLKPNVLVLSSVLQYLERPYEWIEKFINLQIPYIIIDRTTFVNADRDILTIQNVPEEIYKASYPAWFFNKEKLLKAFREYHCLCFFKSYCDNPQMLNNTHNATWEGAILKAGN